MTPSEANDVTLALLEAASAFAADPDPLGVRVIRLPLTPSVLSPEEAESRRIADARDQAERRREELAVLTAFEHLYPGRPVPAHFQGVTL